MNEGNLPKFHVFGEKKNTFKMIVLKMFKWNLPYLYKKTSFFENNIHIFKSTKLYCYFSYSLHCLKF